MRIAIAPCVAVALPLALVFLAAVPQETQCLEPMVIAKSAASELGRIASEYLAHLHEKREAEKIKIRIWMHNGDPNQNGCGFYVQVTGDADGVGSKYFPNRTVHKCGSNEYEMRMTSQGAMYDKEVCLGNEHAETIELHADGWQNTFVNMICIGLHKRTISSGPRAFCINNELLKGCKGLTDKWSNINLEWDDIMMTKTLRGIHKIIFSDIENLVRGFERLSRNPNDSDAVGTVCDRIDLVLGEYRDDYWDCPAQKTWTVFSDAGDVSTWENKWKDEDKNPYGCDRYTEGR